MKPGVLEAPLEIYQGDSFSWYMRVREAGGAEAPYRDLTGSTPKSQVRVTADAATVVVEFSVTLADQAEPETIGGVFFSLTPDQTSALDPGTYVFDAEVDYGGDDVDTYVKGTVVVTAEVTR